MNELMGRLMDRREEEKEEWWVGGKGIQPAVASSGPLAPLPLRR